MSGKPIQIGTVRLLVGRFPERSKEIIKLYDKIEDIREICDDLALAIQTLNYFESNVESNKSSEIADFKEMIDNLHAELIQLVDACH